jgi:hypothetical protein
MESISYSLSVNFVVPRPSGSVGAILIFVSPVIKDSVTVIMYQNIKKKNYPNVRVLGNALLEETMDLMEMKKC